VARPTHPENHNHAR